jgi:cytidylate kinase
MNETKYIEISKSYLYCQLKRSEEQKGLSKKQPPLPFVTVSRETGSGGTTIAKMLVDYLVENDKDADCPWSLFDKNLIQKVLEDNKLQPVIEKLVPENKFSEIQEVFEELFGMHPTRREMIFKLNRSIQKLAEMGNTVIVGRAANVITHRLINGFHIRIVGSKDKRIKHVMDYYNYDKKKAEEFVKEEDKARREFVKKIYGADIEDPHMYNLIMNTDKISYEDAVIMVGVQVLRLKQKLKEIYR